ncbi:DUF6004 family protein [Streptomyces sp. NPDC056361]|uniref:DUF6004 family protein n=1 Tax=Streptomyces sp. NPDC056361 TaxID=3345795 RepID=UPI0035DA2EE2
MSTNETYMDLNIEPKPIRGHLLGAATVVFGDDQENGRRETIVFSGFTQINKWPMPGFEHEVDEKKNASFNAELISAPEVGIKGYSYELNDRIQILTNPFRPNQGRVGQTVAGANFPAEFRLRRFGIIETSTLRLVNKDGIDTVGALDGVPPFKEPLTGPFLDAKLGGNADARPATNVLRAAGPSVAWYTSDDENAPAGDAPALFFAKGQNSFTTMLVDPSLIMQSTLEGSLTLTVDGKTVKVDLAGNRALAGGAEILLFGPEKHDKGLGVQAQLSRLAVVGDCAELGGRVMLRASWARPSEGAYGKGDEDSLSRVAYPADLHLNTHFELSTPTGTLYADAGVPLFGRPDSLEAEGTELRAESADVPLVTESGTTKARITDVRLVMRDTWAGESAPVSD